MKLIIAAITMLLFQSAAAQTPDWSFAGTWNGNCRIDKGMRLETMPCKLLITRLADSVYAGTFKVEGQGVKSYTKSSNKMLLR